MYKIAPFYCKFMVILTFDHLHLPNRFMPNAVALGLCTRKCVNNNQTLILIVTFSVRFSRLFVNSRSFRCSRAQ